MKKGDGTSTIQDACLPPTAVSIIERHLLPTSDIRALVRAVATLLVGIVSVDMEEYVRAFKLGLTSLPADCDLTGVYGRITRGITENDFSRLSKDSEKRFAWVFDQTTLRHFLGMSHLEMLFYVGHTDQWIRTRLNARQRFKLLVFVLPTDEVKLATWDHIFELLSNVYPELDSTIWQQHASELKQKTLADIDPQGSIVEHYYRGSASDQYMTLDRFAALKADVTLLQARAFLHHHVGLNELFRGDGTTVAHDGVLCADEYLTRNRSMAELNAHAMLDMHPTLS